ncbi:5982_t:CDS:2, partial [Racocetra fulgida]
SLKKSSSCLQLNSKVIIQVENSTSMPAKWFTFNLDKFSIFRNQLTDHICKCTDTNNVNINDDIKITYKVNGRGQEMALEDDDDYNAFIREFQKIKKATKNIDSSVINIEDLDSEEEKVKTKRAKKSDRIPKEERLSSNE